MTTCLTKNQLVEKMKISPSKLQTLLNKVWFNEIKELGYRKNDKIISPRILEFIKNNWGLGDENN